MKHPEGAITTKKGFQALIDKAQKGTSIKFWIVRARAPQPRWVDKDTKIEQASSLSNYKRHSNNPISYTFNRKEPGGTLYAFDNYWLAWAYSQRVKEKAK